MELPSLHAASQTDLVDGSFCVGFVHGYMGSLVSGNSGICTNGTPMGELVRGYVAFMEKNPKLLEEDRRVGLQMSLQAAFPCPVTQEGRGQESPGASARSI